MDWFAVAALALLAMTLGVTAVQWIRFGTVQRRDVAIALVPLVTLLAMRIWPIPGLVGMIVGMILFVAAPLLFLRIVRHLEPVPGIIYGFTLVSTASLTAAVFWLEIPARIGTALWMAAVLAPYILAALLMVIGARRRRGVGRRRLIWASLSGLLTALVWVLQVVQSAEEQLPFQGLVLQSAFAFSYVWAFATPRFVREAWRAIEFQRFVASIQGGGSTLDGLLERMRVAASSIVEAKAAFVLTEEDEGGLAISQDAPFPEDDDLAWQLMDAASGEPRLLDGWAVIGLHAVDEPRRALAIQLSSHRLFPGEDDETLHAVAQEIRGRFMEATFRYVEQRARESAEELARFRSEYLRAVAHEVANPLTPIKMQLSMLKRSHGAESPRPFERIEKSLDRLEALIRDVSTIARLGSAGIQLHLEEVDVSDMARDASESYHDVARDAQCKIIPQIEGGVVLPADTLRVRQIVDNLLSNAIKYSPSGGTITVTVRARGGLAEFIVSDQGLGMSHEQLQRLFSSYGRVHTDVAPDIPGTGMGLYIARQLARLHGGDLEAFSQGAGQGTRFKLSLPLTGPPDEAIAAERPPLPGVRIRE